MENKQILTFRYGSDIGEVITGIVREKITVGYDPDAAVEVLRGLFPGIDAGMCLGVISGTWYLRLGEDGVSMDIEKWTPDMAREHPRFYMDEWAEDKLLDMKHTAREWMRALDLMRSEIGRAGNTGHAEIHYDVLARFLKGGDAEELVKDIIGGDSLAENMSGLYRCVEEFLDVSSKILNCIRRLHEMYGDDEIPPGFMDGPCELGQLCVKLSNLASSGNCADEETLALVRIKREVMMADMPTEKYTGQFVDIKPVDITSGFTAGWLSPEGLYYGADGAYNDMIHMNIADALADAGRIPQGVALPERWLAEHGWVRIHGDRVLFEGYMQADCGLPKVALTDKQIDGICIYGKCRCGGYLRLGTGLHRVFVGTFRQTEPLMLAKYFN